MTLRFLSSIVITGSPRYRLCGDELLELIVILLIERLGARKLVGRRDGVGAHVLEVLLQIGLRHDGRVLDQRLRLPENSRSKPRSTVMLARPPSGSQDRGNHREQDDIRMCSRDPAATAASLEHRQNSRQ